MQGGNYCSGSLHQNLPLQRQLTGSWDLALHCETTAFFFLCKEGYLISSKFSGGGGKEWDVNLELDRKTNALGYSTIKACCPKAVTPPAPLERAATLRRDTAVALSKPELPSQVAGDLGQHFPHFSS